MTRESCISHRAKEYMVIIREDYLAIADGDCCAAALLNLFEYWANRDPDKVNDYSPWIEKSLPDFSSALLGFYFYKRLRPKLDILINKKFIENRPSSKLGGATEYRMCVRNVQDALNALKKTPPKQPDNPGSNDPTPQDHLIRQAGSNDPTPQDQMILGQRNTIDIQKIYTEYLSPTSLFDKVLPECPPPTPEERERELSLKAKENSQRTSKNPPLRSDKKTKPLRKTKNPNPDTHFGGVAVAKVYETEPGVINQDFLIWRSQHYVGQGGKWANAPVANALAEIQKEESRALALWQDYQRSLGATQQKQVQVVQFLPAQLTDRQHKEWAQEYQADPEKFMAKPEAVAWWAYLEARPTFKDMIFQSGGNGNGATQQRQSAHIQRKEATPLPNRGGGSGSRGNSARSARGNGSDSRPAPDERLLRERAQHYLQWLSEPPQGG